VEESRFFWGRRPRGEERRFWTLPPSLFDLMSKGESEQIYGHTCRVFPSASEAYDAFDTVCVLYGRRAAMEQPPQAPRVRPIRPVSNLPRSSPVEHIPPGDLVELLTATVNRPDDTEAWSRVTNWIDTNFPSTLVEHQLPVGFKRYWHASKLSERPRRANRQQWSNYAILSEIEDAARDRTEAGWFDHGGRSVIAGLPVLVGEPYFRDSNLLPIAQSLQSFFKCPVSIADCAHHYHSCVRFVVWFTLSNLYSQSPVAIGATT
jgi:hypothetical protein